MTAAALSTARSLDRTSSMSQASRQSMRKSGENWRKLGVIAPQIFAARIAAFLRAAHPHKTADCVAGETGIPPKTVAKWLEEAASPNGRYYHRLIKVYPDLPAFISPDTAPAALHEAARIARQTRLERENAELRRRLSGQLSEILGGP